MYATYVLTIILLSFKSSSQSVQEYSSYEACKTAGSAIVRELEKDSHETRIVWGCFRK